MIDLLIVLPFLGLLLHVLAEGTNMTLRTMQERQVTQQQLDEGLSSVATSRGGGAAAEIQEAQLLLDTSSLSRRVGAGAARGSWTTWG